MEANVRPFLGFVGVDETYIMTVERVLKKTKAVSPELEILSESDIDDSVASTRRACPYLSVITCEKETETW